MNAPFKQTERLGRLTTALGVNVLVLLRFEGDDRLNDLFEYRVEALAMNHAMIIPSRAVNIRCRAMGE